MTLRIIQKLVLISLLSLSALAFADDTSSSTSKYFGGWYGGVQLGAANIETKSRDLDGWFGQIDQCGITPCTAKSSKTNATVGLLLGYDYIVSSQIMGVFAEGSLGNINSKKQFTWNGGDPSYMANSEAHKLGSVRAKYGFVKDNFALYVSGGMAYSDIKQKYQDVNMLILNNEDKGFNKDGNHIGSVFGLGADYAINEKSSLTIDLSRYSFGSKNHEILDNADNNPQGYSYEMKDTIDTVKLEYKYRF